MKEAVLAANDAILSEKTKTPALSSMGTTMVVCAFQRDRSSGRMWETAAFMSGRMAVSPK